MGFQVLEIEVDGSLKNPIVLWTVLLWGVVLGLITLAAVVWWRRGGPQRVEGRARAALILAFVALLYVATPLAQELLGNALFQLSFRGAGRSLASVGLWGGPPVLPAPAFGLTCGIVAGLIPWGRARTQVATTLFSWGGTKVNG